MSASSAERIAQEHAAVGSTLPSSVVSADRRRRAAEALASKGLPTGRDENWRYANLRPVEKVRFAPASGPATLSPTDLPAAIAGYSRYVFVDGVFAPNLSAKGSPDGVSVNSSTSSTAPAANATAADERFAALNDAFAV